MTVVLLLGSLAGLGVVLYRLEQQVKRIADVVSHLPTAPLDARHHVQQPPAVAPQQPAPWDQASYWGNRSA